MTFYPPIKRTMDIVVAVVSLTLLLPAFIVIGFLVRATSPGPVLFQQERVGLRGKRFVMLKFRTMKLSAPDVRNADGSTYNADNDPRLTSVGSLLRKTSVDELPQLWNVLIGEMSLVGGRPDLPDGVLRYSGNQHDRLLVRPGLTSWAIVNGRNNVPVETRKDLDAWYARNVSFALDVKILLMTFGVVLGRKGVINEYSKDVSSFSEPEDASHTTTSMTDSR